MAKRRTVIAVASVALTYLLLSSIGAVLLAEFSLHPARHLIRPDQRAAVVNRLGAEHIALEEASITATDHTLLKAWLFLPDRWNGNAVIALHGVTDNRLGVSGYGEFMANRGYAVLLPDSRAHGESGGNLASYGFRERDDVHSWADWLLSKTNAHCLYGFGESMGAAIMLQSLAAEHRYCAVAVESPFSDFRHAAYERLSSKLGLRPWTGRTLFRPMISLAFVYARLKYGLDLDQVSPKQAVADSHVPVLLIHGTQDVNLLPANSERIHAASPESVLWEVKGAAHCGAWQTDSLNFERRWIGWYQDHPRRL